MKVKELIEELKKYDPDSEIKYRVSCDEDDSEVNCVESIGTYDGIYVLLS